MIGSMIVSLFEILKAQTVCQ